MFKKLWLCHNINKFYKIFGDEIGVVPAHTKLKDIHNNDFMLGVQYDVFEAMESYAECFYEEAYELYKWLIKLYKEVIQCQTL